MAVTATKVRHDDVHGNQRCTVTDVTFDSSYPTGGEPLTAADLGLREVQSAVATIKTPTAAATAIVSAVYDIANSKLKVNTIGAEVANATNLTTTTTLVVQVVAFGV